MKLKELPDEEKPRERLLRYGAKNISNEDLISILIRTGFKDSNVKELSSMVLKRIKHLNNFKNMGVNDLIDIKGLGKTKIITLLAAIELGRRVSLEKIEERMLINNTSVINTFFGKLISSSNKEELLVILLDNKKRLINYEVMYKGTSDSSVVSIKEVLNYAIKNQAAAFIIMHNHPSGVVDPSKEDIDLTNNLISAGKVVGIPLLDHIIVCDGSYYSFFEEMMNEA